MKRDHLVAPGNRPKRASSRPSRAESPYPLGDYVRPPTDPLGRSVSFTFTGPPDLRRIASELLTHRTFGFMTESDVMRWCAYNGLEELSKRAKIPAMTDGWATLMGWLRNQVRDLERAAYEKVLNTTLSALEGLIQAGHPEKAVLHAEEMWRDLDRVDDPYWRKQYREMSKRMLDRARAALKKKKREARTETDD